MPKEILALGGSKCIRCFEQFDKELDLGLFTLDSSLQQTLGVKEAGIPLCEECYEEGPNISFVRLYENIIYGLEQGWLKQMEPGMEFKNRDE